MLTITLEKELNGAGGGWTGVTADLTTDPIRFRYGIQGSGPDNRVSSTGQLEYSLLNAPDNSTGLLGAYSPLHTNCRAGFTLGIGVRLTLSVAGVSYIKGVCRLQQVIPAPGLYEARTVRCVAVDWMDEAARANVSGVAVQVSQRGDQLMTTLLGCVPRAPASTLFGTGPDVYPYALDNTQSESVKVLSEFQKLASSELACIFLKADGTLVYEPRIVRGNALTNVASFTDLAGMTGLVSQPQRSDVTNKVLATAHPRYVDPVDTAVLYSLETATALKAGATNTIFCPFRDPTQKAQRVGGIDMHALVAGTDYAVNAAEDGTGADLTASCSVVGVFDSNGATVTATNRGGSDAWITLLQCRGRGIYDYVTTIGQREDAASQATYGLGQTTIDMPYQADPAVAQAAAAYLVHLYRDPVSWATSVTLFVPHDQDARLTAVLSREIGDRIGITEQVTGLSEAVAGNPYVTRGFFINGIQLELDARNNLTATFTLAPSDANQYWRLGSTALGRLGVTTRLGFGFFTGYTT